MKIESIDVMVFGGIAIGIIVIVAVIASAIPISESKITIHPIGGKPAATNTIAISDGTTVHTDDFGKYALIMQSSSCDVIVTKNAFNSKTITEVISCNSSTSNNT